MPIPVAGYCWLDDATPSRVPSEAANEKLLGPAPCMVVNADLDRLPAPPAGPVKPHPGVPVQWSMPLIKTPDLFHQFRDLSLDRDSILGFANRYGWIGETSYVDYQHRALIPAVGIQTWQSEIHAMIVADQLLSWADGNDVESLKKYFSWAPTGFAVKMALRIYGRQIWREPKPKLPDPLRGPSSLWHEWLILPRHEEKLRAIGWKPGNLVGPSRLAAMNIINERLEKLCHPRLYLDRRGCLTGHWTPVNLLGCIWLQFYLSIIGQLKLRRCTVCSREMNVTESRSTRKMHDRCSRTLRMSRWRAKTRPPATDHS